MAKPKEPYQRPRYCHHYVLTRKNVIEMSEKTGAPVKELNELLREAEEKNEIIKIQVWEDWD